MITLRLPRLGSTMDEGTIIAWRVQPGTELKPGDVLYEVTTDKVNIDVEADHAGRVVELLVTEGTSVRVGDPVAVVEGAEWEAVAGEGNESPVTKKSSEAVAGVSLGHLDSREDIVTPAVDAAQRLRASPAARRLARSLGVNLPAVQGTGPAGRVVQRDVEEYHLAAGERGQTVAKARVIPFQGARAVTARRMQESAQIPQVTLHVSASAEELMQARQTLKADDPASPVSVIDFVLMAVVRTLREHPELNGWVDAEGLRPASQVDLGYAVDDGQALYVVTIVGADHLSLKEIAQARRQLTERVLTHQLHAEDIRLPSFTVSNLGPLGVESFNPLINPPQAGILGVGKLVSGADNAYIGLDLTFDHRALDGAPAGRILAALRNRVEHPTLML